MDGEGIQLSCLPRPQPRHPPLFLDQTEVRKAEKKFWRPGLPSPYLRVWMTTPPPPFLKVWIRHCNSLDYIQTWLNT